MFSVPARCLRCRGIMCCGLVWPFTKKRAEAIYQAANTRRKTPVNPMQVIKPAFNVCKKTSSFFPLFYVVKTWCYFSCSGGMKDWLREKLGDLIVSNKLMWLSSNINQIALHRRLIIPKHNGCCTLYELTEKCHKDIWNHSTKSILNWCNNWFAIWLYVNLNRVSIGRQYCKSGWTKWTKQ